MDLGKEHIYTQLNSLGYTVYHVRPEILRDFPCIIYQLGESLPEYLLDKTIGFQNNVYDIDVFAEKSTDATTIVEEIEEQLSDNGYTVDFVTDIPEDQHAHVNLRVTRII